MRAEFEPRSITATGAGPTSIFSSRRDVAAWGVHCLPLRPGHLRKDLLSANAAFLRPRATAGVAPVGPTVPGGAVVLLVDVEDPGELLLELGILDRRDALDPPVEVSLHPVR